MTSKHEGFCKQNNQLPTKTHDELEDNSNTPKLYILVHEGFLEQVTVQ